MTNRRIVNGILGGLDFGAATMFFGKFICRMFGWIEWAQGLDSAMSIFQSSWITINWTTVFGGAFCVFSGVLIAINFDFLASLWIVISYHRTRIWDATDKNIVSYIYDGSMYGATFPDERRLEMATACFLEAVQSGRLRVAARKSGEVTQSFPEKWDFDGLEFVVTNQGPSHGYQSTSFSAVSKTDKRIVFESIMCDWRQIKKIWPEKRR